MLKMHAIRARRVGPHESRTGRSRAAIATGALAASIFALAFAAPAFAGLKHDFSVFYDCPINNPNVGACIVSTTNSGEFVIG